MTTPMDRVRAAEAELAAATAEVTRLQAKLRAERADQDSRAAEDQPRRLGWADGVAEARRRHGDRDAAGTADVDGDDAQRTDQPRLAAADGRAEAQRRIAARQRAS